MFRGLSNGKLRDTDADEDEFKDEDLDEDDKEEAKWSTGARDS